MSHKTSHKFDLMCLISFSAYSLEEDLISLGLFESSYNLNDHSPSCYVTREDLFIISGGKLLVEAGGRSRWS